MPLLAHGWPPSGLVVAFALNWRTVQRWAASASQPAPAVHEQVVEQPRDPGPVPADALRVKTPTGIIWGALAIPVRMCLWLGGVVRAHRGPGMVLGQVTKPYAPGAGRRGRGQVSGVVYRLAHGTVAQAAQLRTATQGIGVLRTAYIERLNGTFRQHWASLGRPTRHLARWEGTITAGMFRVGTVYNFCT